MRSSALSGVETCHRDSEAWLEHLRREGYSAITVDCYRRDLQAFQIALAHVGRFDMASFGQVEVDLTTSIWVGEGVSRQTISRRFSAIRCLARYLVITKRLTCAPVLAARLPRLCRHPGRTFSNSEMTTLLDEHLSDITDWIGLCDLAIFALQGDAGLSAAEVASLNREDTDNGAVTIKRSCFTPRTVILSATSKSAVDRYLRWVPMQIGPSEPLFINERGARISVRTIQTRFRERLKHLGIPTGRGPSALRRGMGSRLAEHRHPPRNIAAVLGLSPLSVARYFN
ncbi:integrase/recombinase XerC [Bradyrhizobium diazoefficiens]